MRTHMPSHFQNRLAIVAVNMLLPKNDWGRPELFALIVSGMLADLVLVLLLLLLLLLLQQLLLLCLLDANETRP